MADTRLQAAYRRRLDRIRTRTVALVVGDDTSSTSRFVSTVVPHVLSAQEQAVAATDAYMSTEAGLATNTSTEPWGLDAAALVGVHARRGDFLEDVYGRNHRAEQSTFAERMAREVNTDITLAARAASFVHTEGDTRITGYRRIPSGTACGLCTVAATRRYTKSDLQPLHHGCGCTSAPIYQAPGDWRKPDKARLNALYEQANGSNAASLRRITPSGSGLPVVDIVDSPLGPTLIRA